MRRSWRKNSGEPQRPRTPRAHSRIRFLKAHRRMPPPWTNLSSSMQKTGDLNASLRSTATPPKVVLDEAVELAKKFSSEDAGKFVNGILDAVLKSLKNS